MIYSLASHTATNIISFASLYVPELYSSPFNVQYLNVYPVLVGSYNSTSLSYFTTWSYSSNVPPWTSYVMIYSLASNNGYSVISPIVPFDILSTLFWYLLSLYHPLNV